jgi:hypothetical protein
MSRRLLAASRGFALTLVAALLCLPGAAPGEQPTSGATTTAHLECSPAGPGLAGLYSKAGLAESVEVCGGREDIALAVVSADEGSWIDIIRPLSTERAIIYKLRAGNFPTVATDLHGDITRLHVEWIEDDEGRAVALAFPVRAMDPESDEQTSNVLRYFVVRLPTRDACVLGAVASMEDAKALASTSTGCLGDN